jgi:hypothetical protein
MRRTRNVDQASLRKRVLASYAALAARDFWLLEKGAGERAVVAKLAGYLSPLFRGFDVDVEYNRHGVETKKLDLDPECRGGGRKRVYPDIIVHRRGHDRANLMAIEVKKSRNPEPRTCDRAKLRAMKAQFGYEFGLLLELPSGKGAREREPTLEWI